MNISIYPDVFVNTLVASLQGKNQSEAEAIAKNAIEALQAQSGKPATTPFNMHGLLQLKNLSSGIKQEVCQSITQVFIGTYCKEGERVKLHAAIADLFANQELSSISETVAKASKILSSGKEVNEALIEQLLKDGQLSEVLKGFPPQTDIAQVVTICEPIVKRGRQSALVKLMDLIPPKDKNIPLLYQMAEMIMDSIFQDGFFPLFEVIQGISQEQRSDVIMKAAPLLKGMKVIRQGVSSLLRAISHIPQELRSSLISKAKPVMRASHDGYDLAAILEAVALIPQEQVDDVIAHATRVNRSQAAPIISAIAQIPQKERSEVIAQASPLMEGIEKGSEMADILLIIAKMPQKERSGFIPKAKNLMKGIVNGEQLVQILKGISSMPPELQSDFFAKVPPFMEGIKEGQQRADILCLICEDYLRTGGIDQKTSLKKLTKAMPLLEGLEPGRERAYMLRGSSELTEDFIAEVPRLFPHFTHMSFHDRFAIVRLGEIPLGQLLEIKAIAAPFTEGIHECRELTEIWYTIFKIPENLAVVAKVKPLLEGISDQRKTALILQIFSQIPKEKQSEAIDKVMSQKKDITKGSQIADLLMQDIGD